MCRAFLPKPSSVQLLPGRQPPSPALARCRPSLPRACKAVDPASEQRPAECTSTALDLARPPYGLRRPVHAVDVEAARGVRSPWRRNNSRDQVRLRHLLPARPGGLRPSCCRLRRPALRQGAVRPTAAAARARALTETEEASAGAKEQAEQLLSELSERQGELRSASVKRPQRRRRDLRYRSAPSFRPRR